MVKQAIKEGTVIQDSMGVKRKVVHKKTAIENGDLRFFTGLPCKYGHIAERKTSSYVCVMCASISQVRRHRKKMATDRRYKKAYNTQRLKRHHERYATDEEYRNKFKERAREYRIKKAQEATDFI